MKHFYEDVVGGFWFHLSYQRLLNLLPTDTPSTWVEVGVFQGKSLAWLGVEVLNRNLPVTIHAVDSFEGWRGVPQHNDLRAIFDRNMAPLHDALGDRFVLHDTDSVTAATRFPDKGADVIWLDADHSYEAVKADLGAWVPKLAPHSIIGGDDYMWPGLGEAVHEHFGAEIGLIPGWRDDPKGTVNGYNGPWPSWVVRVR